MFPEIDGQLGWNPKKDEVQYIISWKEHPSESESVTSVYGNVEIASDKHVSNVAIFTERVLANSSTTIRHPNGKFLVEIPAAVTGPGQDSYFALSSGYSIDPPEGKMFVAGGVAYNTTALPLTENEAERVELTELSADMTLRFNYSADIAKETLEVCYLNPNVEDNNWEPVPTDDIKHPKVGVVTVTTKALGAYALMMRKEASLSDVEQTLDEVRAAFNSLKLATNGSNGHAVAA